MLDLIRRRKIEIIKELSRVPYLRLDGLWRLRKTERDLDSIMRYMDQWVLRHNAGGYVPPDLRPTDIPTSANYGIQQVRREIAEFVGVLLNKRLDNTVLEIGLGYYGGTHMLWRQMFHRVITIEASPWLIRKFKLSEWLSPRSTLFCGYSSEPKTLERTWTLAGAVDMLFIDGDHTYEGVASDWALYHGLVKPGGILAFHDSACKVGNFGVARFIENLSNGAVDGKPHALRHIIYSDHVGISYEEC